MWPVKKYVNVNVDLYALSARSYRAFDMRRNIWSVYAGIQLGKTISVVLFILNIPLASSSRLHRGERLHDES